MGVYTFLTIKSPGSGYAGQVWQCRVIAGDPLPGLETGLQPQTVALKILHPRSAWKTAFRDALFVLCFQTTFAPRLREGALRAGLIWQELLRRAAAEEFGPGSIARPLGYFWDPALASFVEVCEWVEGRFARLEPDEHLLIPSSHAPPETTRLKTFMDRLADLCRRMGAVGLARQYAWFTFVSQVNILVRAQPGGAFTAVDCRPGLAFPFFLPFTPAHLKIALQGVLRGVWAHYAEVDLGGLAAFMRQHPNLGPDTDALLAKLRADETQWRAALPDLWNHLPRFLRSPASRSAARSGLCADWQRLGWIDSHAAASPFRFWLYLLASIWPFLLRLLAHPAYRRHLGLLLRRPAYRRAAVRAWSERDLPQWLDAGRIPAQHPARHYTLEKTFLSPLPPAWHRFLVDPAARKRFVEQVFIQPVRLLASQSEREKWMQAILTAEFKRGAADPDKARDLLAQVREPRLQGFIRDLGLSFGLDVFSRLVYLSLAWYGLSSGDFLPFGLAVLSPIPPSGPLRFIYVLAALLLDLPRLLRRDWPPGHPRGRVLLARLGALLIAPLRWVGNLFPIVEISAVYPRLAFLLAEHFISRLAAAIPIFGGRGKLLEIWVFQVCFNLPLSLQYWIEHRLAR